MSNDVKEIGWFLVFYFGVLAIDVSVFGLFFIDEEFLKYSTEIMAAIFSIGLLAVIMGAKKWLFHKKPRK